MLQKNSFCSQYWKTVRRIWNMVHCKVALLPAHKMIFYVLDLLLKSWIEIVLPRMCHAHFLTHTLTCTQVRCMPLKPSERSERVFMGRQITSVHLWVGEEGGKALSGQWNFNFGHDQQIEYVGYFTSWVYLYFTPNYEEPPGHNPIRYSCLCIIKIFSVLGD